MDQPKFLGTTPLCVQILGSLASLAQIELARKLAVMLIISKNVHTGHNPDVRKEWHIMYYKGPENVM